MKPDWDKLGDAYAGSSSVVVADVDCTSDEGKDVCEKNGVSGYPTIKYFTAETGAKGEDYQGGREFAELEKFVQEKLAKKCDPKTKTDCDDQEKAYIDKWASKDQEKELTRLEQTKNGDMQPDKKQWLLKRIALLQGLLGKTEL